MLSNKVALFITARLGSQRLPNKHIIDINGIKPISILIRRLKKLNIPIVLTTGSEDINLAFEELCKEEGIQIFFGSPSNIPLRHLEAAEKLNYDFILSIDGDDILTAPEGVLQILEKIQSGADPDNFFYTSGYPFGMNASGYSLPFLKESLSTFSGEKLETGWGRIFPKTNYIQIECHSQNAENWRLSLDYIEDLEVFQNIWNHFKHLLTDIETSVILDYFSKNEVWKLNEHIILKYWENFNTEKSKEI
jgi:spore coat polysaccharide biosynthesis protein SpsF (cytidylyltransferase family)